MREVSNMELAIAKIRYCLEREQDPTRKLLLLDALEALEKYEMLSWEEINVQEDI